MDRNAAPTPEAGTRPQAPPAVRTERERPLELDAPVYGHGDWVGRFRWLLQGTTGPGPDGGFDLGLFGATPVGSALERWRALRRATGFQRAVHAEQVHGAEVVVHEPGPAGLHIGHGYDGHVTRAEDVLLTVSVADCVPIFMVAPDTRSVALLHGGWRGVAAGILECAIVRLREIGGADPDSFWLHLGPSICGRCYEVGPEVHQALGLEPPPGNMPVDLRAVLARRAVSAGLAPDRISISEHCTRCGDSRFYSHRAGDAGRQMGVLGIRRHDP